MSESRYLIGDAIELIFARDTGVKDNTLEDCLDDGFVGHGASVLSIWTRATFTQLPLYGSKYCFESFQ